MLPDGSSRDVSLRRHPGACSPAFGQSPRSGSSAEALAFGRHTTADGVDDRCLGRVVELATVAVGELESVDRGVPSVTSRTECTLAPAVAMAAVRLWSRPRRSGLRTSQIVYHGEAWSSKRTSASEFGDRFQRLAERSNDSSFERDGIGCRAFVDLARLEPRRSTTRSAGPETCRARHRPPRWRRRRR